MAKIDRLERLDRNRLELEGEYLAALISALRVSASGSWGLFDHNQDRWTRANWAPVVNRLCDLGHEIDEMRERLAMEPFALHEEFEASRGPVRADAVGELKQARAWLRRLGQAV